MPEEVRLATAFALALALALIATPVARRVAIATAFYDHPWGYKGHRAPTPYLGGAALVFAVLGSTLLTAEDGVSDLAPVLGAGLGVFAIGTLDDRVSLGILPRLLVQALAAFALWAGDAGWDLFASDGANLAITLAWVVGLANAFNLMDNLDGALGTVGAVAAGGAGVLAAAQGDAAYGCLGLALCGACLGFLPYNLASPSRIFLGDGGSMWIGLLVSAIVMAIPHGDPGWTTLLAAAPLAGLAILDTTLAVVSRLRRGAPVLQGARDHLTHRLMQKLGSTRRVALLLAAAQGALCGIAAGLYQLSPDLVIAAGVTYLSLGIAVIVRLETRPLGPRLAQGS